MMIQRFCLLLFAVCFLATSRSWAELPIGTSMVGVNNADWRAIADYEAETLQAQKIKRSRIAFAYNNNIDDLEGLIARCEAKGIKPMLLVEYYRYFGPLALNGKTIYTTWYDLGRALATRYGARLSHYTAFNEPDLKLWWDGTPHFNDPRGAIPLDDYFQAMKGFADGVHSANSAYKVMPAGYAGFNYHGDWTNRGYTSRLASLFNDGTLDGLNLHNYGSDITAEFRKQQYQFSQTKTASGITRDINHYCTEFNTDRGGEGHKVFLTRFWDVMGVVGNGGNGSASKTGFAMPYTLFETEANQSHGLAVSERPFVPSLRAKTLKLVSDLTASMSFETLEPLEAGLYTLKGGGKKMWVWQNIAAYSTLSSTRIGLTNIPPGATQLKIYRFDSSATTPWKTIATNGAKSLQLTGLPTGETLMIVADSETSSTSFSPLKFDFGSATSATQSGFLSVQAQKYSKILGYGYNDVSFIYPKDRTGGTSLNNSLHLTDAKRSFLVDVPNGTYTVTAYLGDGAEAHTQSLLAEGQRKVSNLVTAAGQISTQTFDVTVSDGQLSLAFESPGTWACAGIEIRRKQIAEYKFDFDTASSPTAAGWISFKGNAFSDVIGFGYSDASFIYFFDRATGGDLHRDQHLTDATRTFLVNLPNGLYNVTVYLGDMAEARYRMNVYAQNIKKVDNLNTAAGEVSAQQFQTSVSNGQLALRFEATNSVWSCAAVEIAS